MSTTVEMTKSHNAIIGQDCCPGKWYIYQNQSNMYHNMLFLCCIDTSTKKKNLVLMPGQISSYGTETINDWDDAFNEAEWVEVTEDVRIIVGY